MDLCNLSLSAAEKHLLNSVEAARDQMRKFYICLSACPWLMIVGLIWSATKQKVIFIKLLY